MKAFQFYTLFFILFLLSLYTTVNAQKNTGGTTEQDPLEVKIFPPSPNTASLGKYGEVPVGLYTGIPQISIPLTSIQDGSLSMPISLSYHAGGIRVEEIASWVGLGWSLNAGGVITRQVRGIPDEDDMNRRGENVTTIISSSSLDTDPTAYLVAQDTYIEERDTESDLYFFNINGISGSFILGLDNKVLFEQHQDIKIEWSEGSNWIITDNQGNKYYLGESKDRKRSAKELTMPHSISGNGFEAPTAWYLLEIEDATERYNIKLNYQGTILSTYNGTNYRFTATPYGSQDCTNGGARYTTTTLSSTTFGVKLKSIETKLQIIEFEDNFDREDLNSKIAGNGLPTKALSRIAVKNKNGTNIKNIDFSYSYFESQLSNSYNSILSDNQRTKRLKLDWIQESNGNVQVPPHRFEYNTTPLPDRLSLQVDFWGFYNGKSKNDTQTRNTLIPATELGLYSNLNIYYEGADRTPNEQFAKAATLEKIIYPTGGNTTFDFEGNMTSDLESLPIGYQYKKLEKLDVLEVTEDMGQVENLFSINNYAQTGSTFHWEVENLDCLDGVATIDCGIIQIQGISDPSFSTITIGSSEGNVFLPNGDYKITGIYYLNYNNNEPITFSVNYSWKETQFSEEIEVGGIRIKKIETKESNQSVPLVKRYEYNQENTNISSGRMAGRIEYIDTQAPNPTCPVGKTMVIMMSNSHYPIIKTQGGYVCYTRVTEYLGESNENGKTVSNYSFFRDPVEGSFPFVNLFSKSNKRGNLLKTEVYKQLGNDYILISTTENEYEYKTIEEINNIKIFPIGVSSFSNNQGIEITRINFDYSVYKNAAIWTQLKSSYQKMYDENNSQIVKEQTTNYFYNEDTRHTLPIRTETIVDGKKLITHTKYPPDYGNIVPTSNNVSKGIYYLQDKNIIGTAIETYTTELDNSTNQEKVISAQMMVYNPNKPYLKEIHQLEANSTLSEDLIENFIPSFINSQGEFVNDTRYEKRLEYFKYDEFGNPLEFGKVKDVHKSYIWGYKNTYPIAEVINASQDQIFHTSFEEEDGNSAIDARTGKKCFRLQNILLLKEDLPRGKYLFSVWVKGTGTLTALDKTETFDSPNEWLRIEFRFDTDVITDINIVGDNFLIDEVRLHPLEAHMITRTYTPLIGVTSETNVNHNSTFYEYDPFGRLHIIRDQEGNIIKRIDYEYKEN